MSEIDSKGYYKKFNVQNADGTPLPKGSECFVLRLDIDPFAREAALYYAVLIQNIQLIRDLHKLYIERGWEE